MNQSLESYGFAGFLLFCRIGGCVFFAPGFASTRIPVPIRLLVAVGVTLALAPLVLDEISSAVARLPEPGRIYLVAQELFAGLSIGFMGRLFLLALQFSANTIWSSIGLAGIPGVPLDEMEGGSPLATLASAAATVIVLNLGLHFEMLRAVLDSYQVIGIGAPLAPDAALRNMIDVLSNTSLLALRLASPFIAYGIVVNIALGLANRFVPQISVYHATTGIVMLGGVFLFYLLSAEWLALFATDYQIWLMRGGF